tara:strand:+ start:11 stop:865 length:855 start_codon:yes stop_codon:yes gene_type:complete
MIGADLIPGRILIKRDKIIISIIDAYGNNINEWAKRVIYFSKTDISLDMTMYSETGKYYSIIVSNTSYITANGECVIINIEQILVGNQDIFTSDHMLVYVNVNAFGYSDNIVNIGTVGPTGPTGSYESYGYFGHSLIYFTPNDFRAIANKNKFNTVFERNSKYQQYLKMVVNPSLTGNVILIATKVVPRKCCFTTNNKIVIRSMDTNNEACVSVYFQEGCNDAQCLFKEAEFPFDSTNYTLQFESPVSDGESLVIIEIQSCYGFELCGISLEMTMLTEPSINHD